MDRASTHAPACPAGDTTGYDRYQQLHNQLNVVTQQLDALQKRVEAELLARGTPAAASGPKAAAPRAPRMPLKFWVRHQIKRLIGMRIMIGRLEFGDEPRPIYVPRWYHRKPTLNNPPTISIATPSYNQGAFLEHTIRSVLGQEYPRLQYVVQDGGSTDDSVAVMERYRDKLFRFESRKDKGQSQAINLGLAGTTGEIMAYLNSDDLLLPGALHTVAHYFETHPDVDVVYGHRVVIDSGGRELGRWVLPRHDDAMLKWADYVPQETMFWRRRLWDKVGGIDESFRFAMDWDLLLRFQAAGAKMVRLPRFLGAFRVHTSSKTVSAVTSTGYEEMQRLRRRVHGTDVTNGAIQEHLRPYIREHMWCDRLYRLGVFRY
ncbi:MAG: glycosyltransferase family 2 protein [Gemmata sp.]